MSEKKDLAKALAECCGVSPCMVGDYQVTPKDRLRDAVRKLSSELTEQAMEGLFDAPVKDYWAQEGEQLPSPWGLAQQRLEEAGLYVEALERLVAPIREELRSKYRK